MSQNSKNQILSKKPTNLNDLKIVKYKESCSIFDTNSKSLIEYPEISEHIKNYDVAFCVTNNTVYCSGGYQVSKKTIPFITHVPSFSTTPYSSGYPDYESRVISYPESAFFPPDPTNIRPPVSSSIVFVANELQCFVSPLNQWINLSPMKTARFGHELVACQNFLFAIGGKVSENVVTKTVEKYDPEKDKWTTVAPTNNEFFQFGSAVHNDKIFIVAHNQFEVYIPEENIWLQLPGPNFFENVSIKGIKLAVCNGVFYAIGGISIISNVKIFEPHTRTWKDSVSMPSSRTSHGVAVVKTMN